MKVFKYIIIALLIVFFGFQFIPAKLNQSNEILSSDIELNFDISEDVKSILQTSCYDCHSNNTNYPWYSKIQPAKWFLGKHIEEGKEELNFSEFGDYSKRKQRSKFNSIASQIENDEMPLPSYTLMHKNAELSDRNKAILLDWIHNLEN